jgi:hypothetical protein
MKHTHLVFAGTLLGGLACAPDARSPLSAAFEPDTPAAAVGLARASTSGTHGQRLTAVTGAGAGIVNVTPTAADDGTFAAQIEVNAHGLPPETTFSVERSPDLVPDGVCTNPAWVPFGVTFTTSAGGAGAAHIDFHRGAPFLSGVSFDVRFRVVGPGAELQTGCFTVTVK